VADEMRSSGIPGVTGLSALATGMVAVHELYLSYRAAGFTEPEALCLVAHMLRPPTCPCSKPPPAPGMPG
jgi:hypothetical protein